MMGLLCVGGGAAAVAPAGGRGSPLRSQGSDHLGGPATAGILWSYRNLALG